MSEETRVVVEESRAPEKPSAFSRARRWIGQRIAGETATSRIKDTWDRMHEIGGFLPLLREGDKDFRRQELRDVLNEIGNDFVGCQTIEDFQNAKFRANMKVYNLLHITGSPWIRGLDDRELQTKMRDFEVVFTLVGDNRSFTNDVFMCAMHMINLCWKAIDVTPTPPILIETKTNILPEKKTGIDPNAILEV